MICIHDWCFWNSRIMVNPFEHNKRASKSVTVTKYEEVSFSMNAQFSYKMSEINYGLNCQKLLIPWNFQGIGSKEWRRDLIMVDWLSNHVYLLCRKKYFVKDKDMQSLHFSLQYIKRKTRINNIYVIVKLHWTKYFNNNHFLIACVFSPTPT